LTKEIVLKFISVISSLTLLVSPALASEKAIEEAYRKASEAVRLKFVPGMLSIRDLGFEAYNAQGQKIDVSLEPTRYELMFKSALSVQLSTRVLKCEKLAPDRFRCTVQHDLTMTKADPKGGQPVRVLLQTRSVDDWVQRPRGWRQRVIRTHYQDYVNPQ
jgi:hypothetical protein